MIADYEGLRRVIYGEGATFIPVCPVCGRFVKADATVRFTGDGGWVEEPNADCRGSMKRPGCGRVAMPFEGFFE